MNNLEIINRSKKILTNKFTGMNTDKISSAIQSKFGFNIKNETGSAKRVAIINGNFIRLPEVADAIGALTTAKEVVTDVDFTEGAEAATKESICVWDGENIAKKLNMLAASMPTAAGYPVDVVLADHNVPDDEGDLVKMWPQNSTKQILDFQEYIKTNPAILKEMTITSTDKAAFAADMEVVKVNPFKRTGENIIDINKFFSRYQQVEDRIEIEFDKPLQLCDDLLWIVTVPAGAQMGFTLRF